MDDANNERMTVGTLFVVLPKILCFIQWMIGSCKYFTVNGLNFHGHESDANDVTEISLPLTEMALSVYYLIAPAECSANLSRFEFNPSKCITIKTDKSQ